jgi:hypothetical protein
MRKTLRVSPPDGGRRDRPLWTMEDVVGLIDARETPKPLALSAN